MLRANNFYLEMEIRALTTDLQVANEKIIHLQLALTSAAEKVTATEKKLNVNIHGKLYHRVLTAEHTGGVQWYID